MGWLDERGSLVLHRNECVRLLSAHAGGVGRVGVVADGRPLIMPVNYRMLGADVVVQIGRGTMLEAVDRGSVLAFEVDSALPPEAWSVYVRGPARRVEYPAELVHAHPVSAGPVVPQPGSAMVVIRSDVLSGRRFALDAGPDDIGGSDSRTLAVLDLRPPVRVAADASLRDAAEAMEAEHTSAVVLGDHPMWVVSEHDLIGGLAAGLGPSTAASDVATHTPISATTTTTVEDAATLMAKHHVEHLLVITAEGELVGLLSQTEALRRLVEGRVQGPPSLTTSGTATALLQLHPKSTK